jgi:beta-lactamase regulating signal transducer with metallopeptidase domain
MSLDLSAIDSWVRPIAEHLLNGLILSTAIFLGSLLVFRLLFREQRWSASTRHRASLLLFFVIAGTPILTALKPAAPRDVPRAEQFWPEESGIERIPPFSNANIPTDNSRSTHRWREPSFWLRWIDWPAAIAISWATLVVTCLSRVAFAINRVRILHRSARALTGSPKLALHRKITIAESSLISSPMAVGLWSPKVLLPAGFESNFSAEDRENVLRHEIAHLERFDDWLNLAQQLCIAFVPVNPFLWILRKRLRLQEEIACDDWALAGADHPKNYANLLARLAAAHQRGPLLASGVSRSGRQLYQRVSRILDKNSNRSLQASWRSTMLAGLSVVGITVGALVWLPAIMWTAPAQAIEVQNTLISQDDKPAALSSEVIMLLKNSALNDADAGVRREAVNALVSAPGDEATSALLAVLNESKDEQVRLLILRRINRERAGEARVKEKLSDLASQEQSVRIRIAALDALARNIDDSVVEKFISIYRSSSEPPIKEACLRGLSGSQSKAAKDFLMSIAKDDPNPMMRRVALRAVSGPMGKRVIVRANRGMIGGMELNDLEYGSLGQFSDGFEETDPNADLLEPPGDMIYLQQKAKPLTQRLEQLKQRLQQIPLPKIHDDQSEPPSDVPLPESPSKKPSESPSPSQ